MLNNSLHKRLLECVLKSAIIYVFINFLCDLGAEIAAGRSLENAKKEHLQANEKDRSRSTEDAI